MKPFFKPEDFFDKQMQADRLKDFNPPAAWQRAYAANFANKILQERGVRVWFNDADSMDNGGVFEVSTRQPNKKTHQAWLTGIEELPKKECVHEAKNIHPMLSWNEQEKMRINPECKHCGVKLKATWEVAE